MKLQPDRASVPTVSSYGPGWLAVDGHTLTHSLLLGSQPPLRPWGPTRFEDLRAEHFAPLAALDCELIVFGSGQRLRFVPAAWLAPLMARRIGLETMDTPAACRTYNFLAGEGRKVAAALLIEAPQDMASVGPSTLAATPPDIL